MLSVQYLLNVDKPIGNEEVKNVDTLRNFKVDFRRAQQKTL